MTTHRLVLTEEQSAFLRRSGAQFAVVHPGSYNPRTANESVGRFVIELVECDHATATAACLVAMGRARAVRVKAPEKSEKP